MERGRIRLAAAFRAGQPRHSLSELRLLRALASPCRRGAGMQPFIVIGRDTTGAPLFLWPLVRTARAAARSRPISAAAMPISEPRCGARHAASSHRSRICASCCADRGLRRIDALVSAQPAGKLERRANPMRLLPSQLARTKPTAFRWSEPARKSWAADLRRYAPQVSATRSAISPSCRAFAIDALQRPRTSIATSPSS